MSASIPVYMVFVCIEPNIGPIVSLYTLIIHQFKQIRIRYDPLFAKNAVFQTNTILEQTNTILEQTVLHILKQANSAIIHNNPLTINIEMY